MLKKIFVLIAAVLITGITQSCRISYKFNGAALDYNIYHINATKIAQEIGLGNRTNTILQSAFFRITEVIPVDLAVEQMKKFIVKSYGKKGEDVVNKN